MLGVFPEISGQQKWDNTTKMNTQKTGKMQDYVGYSCHQNYIPELYGWKPQSFYTCIDNSRQN